MPPIKRRTFLAQSAAAVAAAAGLSSCISIKNTETTLTTPPPAPTGDLPPNPIACSTYSFWRYRDDSQYSVEACIEHSANMGFDGVDILHEQMAGESNPYLQTLKRKALINGIDLCCLSIQQDFVDPDRDVRQKNIDHTIHCIELAYSLGIPIVRLNTGRWNTVMPFTRLMENNGLEPPLPGYTEDDGFPWVIDAIEKCLPAAEKCGVLLGLENHWGLARTAAGLLRIVNDIDSPWLPILLDTGNFLEEPFESMEKCADKTVFIQAKTYFGGGTWYTLDLDYPRIGKMMRSHGFKGYVSLEFEGNDDPLTAIPKSLKILRSAFS